MLGENETDLQWAQAFCTKLGYLAPKIISGHRYACLRKMLHTTAILVGEVADEFNVKDRYCYHSPTLAAVALEKWDGEGDPEGWHRHLPSNRRLAETVDEFDQNGRLVPIGEIYVLP